MAPDPTGNPHRGQPARPRGAPKAGAASTADQLRRTLQGKAVSAAKANRRKKKTQKLGGQRSATHARLCPGRAASKARLMASIGAGSPHQRSKDTAPWCTSISPPSTAGIPRRLAAVTNGVWPGA